MAGVRIFRSPTTDIFVNLALEEWLFRTLPLSEGRTQAMLLWRNKPCIVMGHNQVPWLECDVREAEARDVSLARRVSGGGAVYHDLHNLCVTFFSPNITSKDSSSPPVIFPTFSKERNMDIIRAALGTFNIPSWTSNRTDLLVDVEGAPKKVSGSAFRISGKRAYHHCTLLLDSNLPMLRRLLQVPDRQIEGRGVRSTPHPVANLAQLHPDVSYTTLCEALATAFSASYGQPRATIEGFDLPLIRKDPVFRDFHAEMAGEQWVFGASPNFVTTLQRVFGWGSVHLTLEVKKGQIEVKNVFATTNADSSSLSEALRGALQGVVYRAAPIRTALLSLPIGDRIVEDLADWISTAL
eukprot:GGOE01015360.1.p1 GENE.GGOE01015360.1~~GGOE01015360.1.p1  ORF type:complete len:387 (+),score=93.77 GGOE01015360.1:104-1162(+)